MNFVSQLGQLTRSLTHYESKAVALTTGPVGLLDRLVHTGTASKIPFLLSASARLPIRYNFSHVVRVSSLSVLT